MKRLIPGLALLPLLLGSVPAAARVDHVEIVSRREMALGYERIEAKVYFVFDVANPHNKIAADLDKAEKPEAMAELILLRPTWGGNGILHLEIPNRGGGRGFDPAKDDFLFRRGYTVAALGWQFDVRDEPERLHFTAPVARGLRGLVRSDFIVEAPQDEHTIGHFIAGALGGKGYPLAAGGDKESTLTERDDVTAPRRAIPRGQWHFSSSSTIRLDGGFQPGKIYEIVYPAENPAVVGAGMAGVRDFVAYLKHDPASIAPVKLAFGFGISQCGRFLRHFVYDGFNADEEGRQVFDGLLVNVAGGGRGGFNHRFAQPSRDAGQIVPAFYPVDVFPFTDLPTTDPATGKTAGLLDRATAERVVPKIFYLNTGYEYWGRGASLIHTTPDGKTDVEPAPTSRIYLLNGVGHVGGPWPPEQPARVRQPLDFLNYWPLTHALVDALEAWVVKGTEPPPSRYPRLADGNLVDAASLPAPAPPDDRATAYQPFRVDGAEPPKILGTYPGLVPKVDADGNELGGVRLPFLTTPLGAYRPFNLRTPAIGFPQHRVSFFAAFLPFTKAQAAERYPGRDVYLGRFTADALQLVGDRYLVKEDFLPLLSRAAELWDWVQTRPGAAP